MEQSTILPIIVILSMVISAMVVRGAYKFGHEKTIDIKVKSRSTGFTYHAIKYRTTPNGPELRIYNWAGSQEFEWLSVWHFVRPMSILINVDVDYVNSHYLQPGMPPIKTPKIPRTDFTKPRKKLKANED